MKQTKYPNWLLNLAWFLLVPVSVFFVLSLLFVFAWGSYQAQHENAIYEGVSVWGVDLSGMSAPQAAQALQGAFPYTDEAVIRLTDPKTGQAWVKSPAELGLFFDINRTIQAALIVGREATGSASFKAQFDAWYYGKPLAPVVIFDESRLDTFVNQLSAEINQPPANAALYFDGNNSGYETSQAGRSLDVTFTREQLLMPLENLREAEIELLVHEIQPQVQDAREAATLIEQIIGSPMTLYLQQPFDGNDLGRVVISIEELTTWLRIELVTDEANMEHYNVFVDEQAVRIFLQRFAQPLAREPENARFYFDDDTRKLVLVEAHRNGRELDIEATLQQFLQQVNTANRSLPFVVKEVVPMANAAATSEELGIVELVGESTTWFRGSPSERKHNIARSASNFYGIVVGPGEEFSFNRFLGDISEEDGYAKGLIIYGGRTIEGVGGGVCQVSTTVFQAAFWSGFPIVERWAHGYQVSYYDDGEGTGMDATVYSPLVDFRFINDTPHHLLIENYYDERTESLTFKFYSTDMGRTVVKEGPFVANTVPAKPDVWEFDSGLSSGEVKQVDWAVEGAEVIVNRTVYNFAGEPLRQDKFFSRYIPWQSIYQYGPDVEPPPPPGETPPGETPPAEDDSNTN